MDLNVLTNKVGNYDYINYQTNIYVPATTLYSLDNDMLFNYSSKFDYNSVNLGMYITSMTGSSKFIFIISYFFCCM